ncbi:DeoR/GlpR family DNA-binding transcription regulator [Kitasatospora indigofera]|uniref:DeoR/GlpR family DNA-binding transcription regulator n=1 Tax=Kitasatospora indigofera TaxID=67307 RepID=UPI00365EEF15
MSAATDHLLSPQRRRVVLGHLRNQGTVQVAELAQALGISPSTVRRDLQEMEDEGLLARVHGGATLVADDLEADQPARAAEHQDQKRRIGAAAAALVQDGTTVLISGGTTTETMVGHLADRENLTVITNSLAIAHALARHPSIAVVVLGGFLRHREKSLLGHLTEQALAEFRIDQVFTGAFGVDPEVGVTGADVREARTDRALLEAGGQHVLLADAGKLGRRGPVRLVPAARISALVTDADPAHPVRRGLAAAGVPVIAC